MIRHVWIRAVFQQTNKKILDLIFFDVFNRDCQTAFPEILHYEAFFLCFDQSCKFAEQSKAEQLIFSRRIYSSAFHVTKLFLAELSIFPFFLENF